MENEHPLLRRISLAMPIGKVCVICGHEYDSVDDIIKRNPVRATPEFELACENCWNDTESEGEN